MVLGSCGGQTGAVEGLVVGHNHTTVADHRLSFKTALLFFNVRLQWRKLEGERGTGGA